MTDREQSDGPLRAEDDDLRGVRSAALCGSLGLVT